MTPPLRVLVWATGFQADIQALAHFLGREDGIEVTVALDDPARYAREPVNRLLPVRGRMVDRRDPGVVRALARDGFDVVIVDNHLPPERLAPRLLVLWHGFGWRIDDLATMRKELRGLVGDVTVPNPRFRWAAFGEWDRNYRIEHSRLAAEHVIALGSAYSDLLLPAAERRGSPPDPSDSPDSPDSPDTPTFPSRPGLAALVRDAYPVDLSRKNILLALTWHHGGALAHWGPEAELLDRLFAHAEARGANLVVRLHDRQRYEPEYLALVERAAARAPHVALKYKSDHPDSLVDLLLADVVVSNYSSLLNAAYYTRRPTVHLDPHEAGQTSFTYRRYKGGRVRQARVDRREAIWKLDPGEIGGLRAGSFEEALALIDRALAEPECCEALARGFTDRYITGVDGRTRARITGYLRRWAAETPR